MAANIIPDGSRFIRNYMVRIGSEANPGFVIDSRNQSALETLNIEFDIKKTHDEKPNEYKLTLFNLSPKSQEYLNTSELNVELYAGYDYETDPQLIAKGIIVDVSHNNTDVTKKSEITFYDGWKELRDTVIHISYEKGHSVHSIMRGIASTMKMVINFSKNCPDKTFKKGFSYTGSPDGALGKLCAKAGLTWSIQNGAIYVTKINSSTQKAVTILNANSGMIGSPIKQKLAKKTIDDDDNNKEQKPKKERKNTITIETKEKERTGWKVTSLLLPTILPADLVIIESTKTTASGTYRVESVQHKGSMDAGSVFQTELVVAEDEEFTYTYTKI